MCATAAVGSMGDSQPVRVLWRVSVVSGKLRASAPKRDALAECDTCDSRSLPPALHPRGGVTFLALVVRERR